MIFNNLQSLIKTIFPNSFTKIYNNHVKTRGIGISLEMGKYGYWYIR